MGESDNSRRYKRIDRQLFTLLALLEQIYAVGIAFRHGSFYEIHIGSGRLLVHFIAVLFFYALEGYAYRGAVSAAGAFVSVYYYHNLSPLNSFTGLTCLYFETADCYGLYCRKIRKRYFPYFMKYYHGKKSLSNITSLTNLGALDLWR